MPKTSRIIEEMHESLQALDELGLMEPQEVTASEALYDACKVPQYSPENERNLRSRISLTQMALAAILSSMTSVYNLAFSGLSSAYLDVDSVSNRETEPSESLPFNHSALRYLQAKGEHDRGVGHVQQGLQHVRPHDHDARKYIRIQPELTPS